MFTEIAKIADLTQSYHFDHYIRPKIIVHDCSLQKISRNLYEGLRQRICTTFGLVVLARLSEEWIEQLSEVTSNPKFNIGLN